MLTASLLALVLIASSLVFISFLCGRGKPRNGSLKLSDESETIQRETSGSEVRVDVIELNCNSAFQSLTANQQKYAHYATRSFFDATLSVYFQISTEAAGVFIMLYRLFAFESMDRLRAIAEACDFTENEWNNFIVWSALRLSRYSSGFRYAKLVGPRVDEMKFKNLIANSEGAAEFPGTRRLYVPVFLDIFHSHFVPYTEKISENIKGFVQNTNRKLDISLKTAKLDNYSVGIGGYTDSKCKIRFLFSNIYPPGKPEYSQGFVGIGTKTFSRLTNNVKRILKKLPWGKDYENNKVGNPKLTSFDLIAFAFHGVIEGLNITPKGESDSMDYCHVFRNLIVMEPNHGQRITVKENDLLLFEEYRRRANEMQTALHELFGHGTGKLFKRFSNGRFNFNKNRTVDILTGGCVTSWYEPGETYKSVFGDLADAFEECKADTVGHLLSCDVEVLKLLGYTGDSAEKIKYTNCLMMVVAGMKSILGYKVRTKTWGQNAHCWARFVLLKVFLEAGEGYLTIEQTKCSNGDRLLIHLDRTKIDSVGVPAVREFLKKLQALKSTADVEGARALFDRYTVGPTEVEWRAILDEKARDLPRVFLQPNTVMNTNGSVELKRYPVSAEGVIQSVIERYSIDTIDEFEELWRVEMEQSTIVGYMKELFPNDTAETRYDAPIIN